MVLGKGDTDFGNSVVVLSSDVIGERMAGPGIRYRKMAEVLSQHFPTILAAPCELPSSITSSDSVDSRLPGFAKVLSKASVVITQGYNFPLRPLFQSPARLIVDLYDPVPFEILGMRGLGDDADRDLLFDWTIRKTNLLLSRGDHFLCASERQRSMWLGNLLSIGRLNHDLVKGDPNLDLLTSIIPFGIEDRPFPRNDGGLLRQSFQGISDDDIVIYWGGGLWDWLDPQTAIRAMALIRETHPSVKLVFLAGTHPNPDIPAMGTAESCRRLADELSLTDRQVFFVEQWVPYESRHRYLSDATIGLSLHHRNLESTYSFRTRLLDYLWAGLPMVLSEGDELSNDLVGIGAAVTVKPGEAEDLAKTFATLADDSALRNRMAACCTDYAARYSWNVLLERLVPVVDRYRALPPRSSAKISSSLKLTDFYARTMVQELKFLGLVDGLKRIGRRFGL